MKLIALPPRPLLSKEQLTHLRHAAKRSTVRLSVPAEEAAFARNNGIRGVFNYTLSRVV